MHWFSRVLVSGILFYQVLIGNIYSVINFETFWSDLLLAGRWLKNYWANKDAIVMMMTTIQTQKKSTKMPQNQYLLKIKYYIYYICWLITQYVTYSNALFWNNWLTAPKPMRLRVRSGLECWKHALGISLFAYCWIKSLNMKHVPCPRDKYLQ